MRFIGGIFGGAVLWLVGWETISGFSLGLLGLAFLMLGGFSFEFSLFSVLGSELSWECLIFICPLMLLGFSAYCFKLANRRLDSGKPKDRIVSRQKFEEAVKYLHSQGYSAEQIINIATGKVGARA